MCRFVDYGYFFSFYTTQLDTECQPNKLEEATDIKYYFVDKNK